jgi:DNA sulfur modification protein DndE
MTKKLYYISFIIIALITACNRPDPVIYLIGDSTMSDKPDLDYPERGWGQLLPTFFNSSTVIDNHARNGRSTRSFIYEGRWDSILTTLNPGDFVVIQFGHNDGSESKIARYATPDEYRYNITKFINETLNSGARPIVCTPIARRKFIDGTLSDTHSVYPEIAREIAKNMNVPLIDMHKMSIELLTQLGEENSLALFLQIPAGKFEKVPEGKIDNTHLSEKGAVKIASLFVNEIKKQNIELAKYLIYE